MTTGTFDLQTNFFDAIMPKMLPMVLTLLVYTGMKKKDISALKMMGILIVVGAVLGIIGLI